MSTIHILLNMFHTTPQHYRERSVKTTKCGPMEINWWRTTIRLHLNQIGFSRDWRVRLFHFLVHFTTEAKPAECLKRPTLFLLLANAHNDVNTESESFGSGTCFESILTRAVIERNEMSAECESSCGADKACLHLFNSDICAFWRLQGLG